MTWETAVQGSDFDLRALSNLLTSNKLSVTHDDERGYLLRTCRFDDLATAEEVNQCAEDILPTLRGIATLSGIELDDITIGAIYEVLDDGTRINRGKFLRAESSMRIRDAAYITVIDGNGTIRENVPFGDRIIEGLDCEPNLQEVVDLLPWSVGQPRRLYFMYEMIVQLAGNPVTNGWISDADKKRFKHSMQDRRVYGMLARHGAIEGEPPRSPMLIDEANSFILTLIKKWIEKVLVLREMQAED